MSAAAAAAVTAATPGRRGPGAVCALLLAPKADGAGQPCPACQAAQIRAHSPLFRADCHGCKVRALALGPQFWRSMQEGAHTDAYQGELAAVFGESGAALGHAVVLAEHLRLKSLRHRQRGQRNHRNDDTTDTTPTPPLPPTRDDHADD